MEPEVHIIEKYFQNIHHCFTMTNVKCKGNKEIDLLAVNPRDPSGDLRRFHVEARVSTTFPLRMQETKTTSGKSNKNGLDYFIKEKFYHPSVLERAEVMFGTKKYDRVLVVHSVKGMEFGDLFEKVYNTYGIMVWRIGDLIHWLRLQNYPLGSRDDVLRLIELIYYDEKMQTRASVRRAETLTRKRFENFDVKSYLERENKDNENKT
jgi:hypothetical protein